jgi:hypothetical protein
MIITEEVKQLSEILEILCIELDISLSQYEDAKRKYEAVSAWLDYNDSELVKFEPEIYPQGSFSLGTTVKPLGQEEFDIDLVCELQNSTHIDQRSLKMMVGTRLSNHETYKTMLEEKNRCWRLNYAGSFHMDILPAIPNLYKCSSCILIPDRKLSEWKESNPKGYVDWFESKMLEIKKIKLKEMKEIEGLPEYIPDIKTPLQRSVQLLKRHRDITFRDDAERAPISIVITTLAAKAYWNEPSLYNALLNIIDRIPSQVDYIYECPAVINPTNESENFAEKWTNDPGQFDYFNQWLLKFRQNLNKILEKKGFDEIGEALSTIFGEDYVKKSIVKYSERLTDLRKKGQLRSTIRTGILGAMGNPIKKNTFYGA